MENNKKILNDFMSIKEKFYDEAIIEDRIIELEAELKKIMSKKEKIFFNQILENYQRLQYLENLRLIDYINKKTN